MRKGVWSVFFIAAFLALRSFKKSCGRKVGRKKNEQIFNNGMLSHWIRTHKMIPRIKFWSWTKHSVRLSSEGKDQAEGKWYFLGVKLPCSHPSNMRISHQSSVSSHLAPKGQWSPGFGGKCSGQGARRPWASHFPGRFSYCEIGGLVSLKFLRALLP